MSGLPCNERMDCTQCPKAVENSIHYTHNKKGFHLPPHKCETNILFFLLKGQILINSEEYAGTIINSGEFVLQAIASKVEILAMTDSEGILYTLYLYIEKRASATHLRATENKARNKAFP